MSQKIYFETKVGYQTANDEGKQVKVSEVYVLEADTFAEVENKMIAEIGGYKNVFDFDVQSIKKTNYSEIHESSDSQDTRFKCKVEAYSTHPETGKRIVAATHLLVQAEDSKGAIDTVNDLWLHSMTEYEITAVVQTPVVEVFFKEDDADDNGHELM